MGALFKRDSTEMLPTCKTISAMDAITKTSFLIVFLPPNEWQESVEFLFIYLKVIFLPSTYLNLRAPQLLLLRIFQEKNCSREFWKGHDDPANIKTSSKKYSLIITNFNGILDAQIYKG